MTPDITSAAPPPWPVRSVPWTHVRKNGDAELRRIVERAGLGCVLSVGPAEGPLSYIGSAVDPREKLTRLAKASPVPLFVHSLRWAQGLFARRLAKAINEKVAGKMIGPGTYALLLDDVSKALSVRTVDHLDYMAAIVAEREGVTREAEEWAARFRPAVIT